MHLPADAIPARDVLRGKASLFRWLWMRRSGLPDGGGHLPVVTLVWKHFHLLPEIRAR